MTKPRETIIRQIPRLHSGATAILGWALSVGLFGGCDSSDGRGGGNHDRFPPANDFIAGGGTFVTPDGEVAAHLDERLRPIRFTGSGLTARLSWSDDARSVEGTVDASGRSVNVVLETDFSDTALLEALDRAEAETGLDAGPLREWIAQNPGRAERIASGGEVAPVLAGKESVLHQETPSLEADRHVSRLAQAVLALTAAAERLLGVIVSTDTAAEGQLLELYGIMRQAESALGRIYNDHAAACIPRCTLACPVSCAEPNLGVCCGATDEAPGCDYTSRDACPGVFWEGFTCNEVNCDVRGACCVANCPAHNCYDDVTDQHCREELGGDFHPSESCDSGDPCLIGSTCTGCCIRAFPGGVECAQTTLDECGGPNQVWDLINACGDHPECNAG